MHVNDPFAKVLDALDVQDNSGDVSNAEVQSAMEGLQMVEETAQEVPEGPPDPFAHLVGLQSDGSANDPFAAMLDGMLASEGMSKDDEVGEKNPEPELHDWESDRETLYSSDTYTLTCRKCIRSVGVQRDETVAQAMQRHGVARDCSVQITAEVMDA